MLAIYSIPNTNLYQIAVMLFGLHDNMYMATFQRLMNRVLHGSVTAVRPIWMMILSITWEEHLQHLSLVLERSRRQV